MGGSVDEDDEGAGDEEEEEEDELAFARAALVPVRPSRGSAPRKGEKGRGVYN